jgi:hypothetical protein
MMTTKMSPLSLSGLQRSQARQPSSSAWRWQCQQRAAAGSSCDSTSEYAETLSMHEAENNRESAF